MRTIAAISTPAGSGAIAVVRMSGSQSLSIADKIFKPYKIVSILNAEPNKMYLGVLTSDEVRDKCLCVYFQAPFSYTGEDVVEIHCHGGSRLSHAILDCLIEGGCALAEKGEFTRRAYFNNKLSLSQAEGIIDMINSESLSQINGAYSLQSGVLSTSVSDISDLYIDACAHLEVILDSETFEDESIAKETASSKCLAALSKIENLLNSQSTCNRYGSEGIRVAIVGQTNMGKSSLLNCLCGYKRAIVTDIAGTTRDIIEEKVEYNGYLFRFIDTAGIRESNDKVEEIGIALAKNQAESCDIVLIVVDGVNGITQNDYDIITAYKDKPLILCVNKIDLVVGDLPFATQRQLTELDVEYVKISALSPNNNSGIDLLLSKISNLLGLKDIGGDGQSFLKDRHIAHLNYAKKMTVDLIEDINNTPIDCILSELYNIVAELKNIDGADANNIVIDTVFSKFCVGK